MSVPTLAGVEAHLGATSLREFLPMAWSVIEPETPYVGGYHIDAVGEHLEAALERKIRNLAIMMPPRHTKSIQVSVAFPVWAWIRRPATRFLYGSYSATLSTDHAVASRRILESDWFAERWGPASEWARETDPATGKRRHTFALTTDQNVKTYYENTARGYRFSTSVGGTVTGHGGDILVGDDLHNIDEIDSKAERDHVVNWWRKTFANRLNDPKTGVRIIVMQRGHMQDVIGWLLENQADLWEVLKLPTEYDPKKTLSTSIGWRDPRTAKGELLCPERFGPRENEEAKRTLGPAGYAAQHGQEPIPEGGLLFKREWFRVVNVLPAGVSVVARVRFWDMAATEGAGCRTAGVRMLKLDNGLFVIDDVVKGQWSNPDPIVKQTAGSDGVATAIREEQEPGSAGKAVIRARKAQLAGYDYDGVAATGSKETRAKPLKNQAEVGNVLLLESESKPWTKEFLDEIETFPAGEFKDQTDAAAGAFNQVVFAGKDAGMSDTAGV